MPDEPATGLDIAYDNALQKLDQQQRLRDEINGKAATILALLGVGVGGYALYARTFVERLIGGIFLALSIVTAVFCYASGQRADAPNPATVARFTHLSAAEIKTQFLDSLVSAYQTDEEALRAKRQWLIACLVVVTTLGLLIIAGVIVGTWYRV